MTGKAPNHIYAQIHNGKITGAEKVNGKWKVPESAKLLYPDPDVLKRHDTMYARLQDIEKGMDKICGKLEDILDLINPHEVNR